MKKNCLLLLTLCLTFPVSAQEIRLTKGAYTETLPLNDSIGRNLSVFIPSNFDTSRNWPVLFVCDLGEDPATAMRFFKGPAEASGYILATSRALADSISLTQKVLYFARSLDALGRILPLDRNRIYAGGYGVGAQFASLLPNMVKSVAGVLSVSSGPPNSELVSARTPFHYVGLLGRSDHRYTNMLAAEETLDRKKIRNLILYYDEPAEVPSDVLVKFGMQSLTLMSMAAGRTAVDSAMVSSFFDEYLEDARRMGRMGKSLQAYHRLEEGISLFEKLADVSPMEQELKQVRRETNYRNQKRAMAALLLKEGIMRQDYEFYLEDDVLSFNLDNLGWWKYQMELIDGYKESKNPEEQLLGLRLEGFLNALTDDYLRIASSNGEPDDDARVLLYMLKTITAPEEPENYLNVISLASKYDDFGTALFYLEELLKTGYSDREKLYSLEHTALLRISPEFNELIAKYLKEARYDPEPPERRFYLP